ncbi:di-trans,poly-cis-decaprenylcistransferase, partial [Pseudoalteromonas sp. S3260]
LHKNNVKLSIIGDMSRFSNKLQEKIAAAESLTAENTGLRLNIAANYGGRWDIGYAAQQLAKQVQAGELSADDIDEHSLAKHISLN